MNIKHINKPDVITLTRFKYVPHSTNSFDPCACDINVFNALFSPYTMEKLKICKVMMAIPAPAISLSVPKCPMKAVFVTPINSDATNCMI